ncbi:MAG: hypothetical protein SNJ52_00870, partial [Verrucomicrobiia bacterium]
MIRANCRASFTADDFAFIVRTLSNGGLSAVSLAELLADEETRDVILDQERLVRAVMEQSGALSISSHLYFYLITRHVLRAAGITCRNVTDYIASLLTAFSNSARLADPGGNTSPSHYLSDILLALKNATPRQAFLLRAHIGNYSLFLTGIFHERVHRRAERGAPDCSFYEQMGSACFHEVSRDTVARSRR